jgi:hypothetical protein
MAGALFASLRHPASLLILSYGMGLSQGITAKKYF